jgi:hypothetical protein
MPEPMVTYSLCDYDFRTVDKVKMIRGLGASFRNARAYFYDKGWKGKFILLDDMKNKYVMVRFSPVPKFY